MTNHPQQTVQKLWNYCNILRDDGLSYGDYVEQPIYFGGTLPVDCLPQAFDPVYEQYGTP